MCKKTNQQHQTKLHLCILFSIRKKTKTLREIFSRAEREREIPTLKFLFWTGQAIFTTCAREKKSKFDTKSFFKPKRASVPGDAREKRERATFATTRREFGGVGCFDGVRDWKRARAQWRHFTTLKCTWPANHLNALRFRCWRCVWNSSSSDQNVANNVMKRWQNGKRGVSQNKITVSEADSTDSKFYGSDNSYNNTSEQVH